MKTPAILIPILILQSQFWNLKLNAQDCTNDTIPPEMICHDSVELKFGWCGNEQVYPWTFLKKVTDNCKLANISFDPQGMQPYPDVMMFEIQYGRNNLIPIYAFDTAGNRSQCYSYFSISDDKYYSNIAVKVLILSEFSDYTEQLGPFQIGLSGKKGEQHSTSLNKLSNNSISIPINKNLTPTTLYLKVDSLHSSMNSLITTYDINYTALHIVGRKNFQGTVNEYNADMNQDGYVDIRDLKSQYEHILQWNPQDPTLKPKYHAHFIDDLNRILGTEQNFHILNNELYLISLDQLGNISRAIPESSQSRTEKIISFPGESIFWNTRDIDCKSGHRYQVKFRLSDSSSYFAIQSSLDFDPSYLKVDTVRALIGAQIKFYHNVYPEGVRTLFLDMSKPKTGHQVTELVLEFTALKNFSLHQAFEKSNPSISNYILHDDNQIFSVKPKFINFKTTTGEGSDAKNMGLWPNPSTKLVRISKFFPALDQVELTITDVRSQTVYRRNLVLHSGYLNHELELKNKGMYFMHFTNQGRLISEETVLIE
ncbi:MAG: hypothetical protein IPM34_12995 [Saprospiraceae bacterium]|nr:hypothetical protein [Saprospiraceae bacterium]